MPGMVSYLPVLVLTNPAQAATNFRSLTNAAAPWDVTEDDAQTVFGGSGAWTLSNLVYNLTTAPGVGSSYTFTIRINAVDTALAVTIADNATTATDSTHSITVNPGDKLCIKSTFSGTPAATGLNFHNLKITGSVTNATPLLWGSSNSHVEAAGNTTYHKIHGGGTNTVENNVKAPCPTAGTISHLYAECETAPGASQNATIMLRVNGADTALTCQIAGTNRTANDVTHSVTINPGDLVNWRSVMSAGAASTRIRVGARFSPTTDGEFFIIDSTIQLQNLTQYTMGTAGNANTEAQRQFALGDNATVKNLYVDASPTPPAAGQTQTFTFRKNAVSQSLTAQVTNGAPVVNDTAHQVAVGPTDLICLQLVTSATSGTVTSAWGFVIAIAQGGGGGGSTGAERSLMGAGS